MKQKPARLGVRRITVTAGRVSVISRYSATWGMNTGCQTYVHIYGREERENRNNLHKVMYHVIINIYHL